MVALAEKPLQASFEANIPQNEFLTAPEKIRAFVAGFGSGKTVVGSAAMCQRSWECPKTNQGYFGPSYPQIRDIFYPTIDEVAYLCGLRVVVREGNHEVHFYSGPWYRGTTICRSMDKPNSIVGFKIAHAFIDEIDVMPTDKAREAYRKILARLRWPTTLSKIRNGIDLTTTPEGFKFTYDTFVTKLAKKPELKRTHRLIQASTFQNAANLPEDYIQTLIDEYPAELIAAYLNGRFVNLTTGTVYRCFDRHRCNSTETHNRGERLYVGMDFNVTKMSAVVWVPRGNDWHGVSEVVDAYDTPAMIETIKERFDGHNIAVYPDASGGNRKTVNASETDLSLLRQAGFTVYTDKKNPSVKDRVNSMNRAFEKGRAFVNSETCPEFVQSLEQQAYDKNGEPDKTSGKDHLNDAGGYFIVKKLPIVKPSFKLDAKVAR